MTSQERCEKGAEEIGGVGAASAGGGIMQGYDPECEGANLHH